MSKKTPHPDAALSDKIKANLKRELGTDHLESCGDNSAAGPDEGSASDKIKALLKYEPNSVFAIEARRGKHA